MSQQVKLIDIGEGFPLVFQHGLTAHSGQIVNLLSGIDDTRLLCMDCPGQGDSILDDSFVVSFDNYSDRLLTELDTLGIDSFIMGGLSMGSGLAINIALRCPEKIKALIVHRPAWLDKGKPENLMVLEDAFNEIGTEGGKERFMHHPSFVNLKKNLPAAADSVLGIFNPQQQASLPEVIRAMVADRPFTDIDRLTTISCPTLVTGNEDDPLHPLDMAEQIHGRIKGSQFVKLTSRYINNEQHVAEFRTAISTFLNSIKAI